MKKKDFLYDALNEKDKNHLNFVIACEWLNKKMNNHDVISYLHTIGIHSVAIYGVGELGKLLIEELLPGDIDIRYCIDNGIANLGANIKVVTKNDVFDAVDAIIVTPCFYYYDIKQELEGKTSATIISLEKIIYEM